MVGLPAGVGDIVAFVSMVGDKALKAQLDQVSSKADKTAKKINKVLNMALMAGAAAFTASALAAGKFESAFAGVTKTVDGLRDPMGELNDEGERMAQAFRDLALEIPVTVTELAKIGELGGQLGIPKQDLIEFTGIIAQLGVTTNLSIEEGSTALARFVNITQTVAPAGMSAGEQIGRIASTVVDLGNNMATTEQEIVAFALRIAGAGTQVGLSQAEILGLGAALSSVGIRAEAGGTAISRIMKEIAVAVETGVSLSGVSLESFADVVEMSASDFKTAFETDAAGAILTFITSLNNISESGESVFATLADLELDEIRVSDAALRASTAHELFAGAVDLASTAYKTNNALNKEAAQRFATTESQLKLLINVVNDAFIELGNNFLPAINSVLKSLNKHPVAIKAVINAFSTMAITAGTLTLGFKTYNAVATIIPKVNKIAAKSFGPWALAITVVVGAIALLVKHIQNLKTANKKHFENVAQGVLDLKDLESIYNELKKTSVNVEAAHQKVEKAQKALNNAIASGSGDVDALRAAYNLARQEEADAIITKTKIQEAENALSIAYQNQGITVSNTATEFGNLSDVQRQIKYDDFINKLGQLQQAYEETKDKTHKLVEATNQYGISFTKEVTYPEAQRAAALKEISDQMANVRSAIDLLNPAQQSYLETGNKIADMSEDTKSQIEAKIKAYQDLLPQVKDNKELSNQYSTAIETLKIKMASIIDPTNNVKTAQELLEDAGIETTQMIKDQIIALENLKPIVEGDDYAIAQLKLKEDELYSSMAETYKQAGDTTNWLKYYQMTMDGQQTLKDNAEAGLKIRDSLQEQKDKLKGTNDALALYSSVITTTLPMQKSSFEIFKDSVTEIQNYGNEIIIAVGKLGTFGSNTNLVQTAFNNFMNSLKDQTAQSLYPLGTGLESVGMLISGFSTKSDKASQAAGLLTSALGTVLKGGFDPLSLGISVVTGLIGIFGQKEEKVVLTTEQVIERLGELGTRVEETGELVDELARNFESALITRIQSYIDFYIESLKTATGETKKYAEGQLAYWQGYLEELTAAFQLGTEFDQVIDGLDYVTQYVIDSIAKFGAVADTAGLTTILQEQISSASLLLTKLDPASAAYEQLKNQIKDAVIQMVAMNETVDFFGNEVNAAELQLIMFVGGFAELEQGTQQWQAQRDMIQLYAQAMYDAGTLSDVMLQTVTDLGITLQDTSQITDEAAGAIENMNTTVYSLDDQFKSNIKTLRDTVAEVKNLNNYYGGFDSSNLVDQLYDQIEASSQLLTELPKDSQAYNELGLEIYNAFLQIQQMGGEIDPFINLMSSLGLSISDLEQLWQAHNEVTEDSTLTIEQMMDQMLKLDNEIKKQTDIVTDLEEKHADLITQYDNATSQMKYLKDAYQIFASGLDVDFDLVNLNELHRTLADIRGEVVGLGLDWDTTMSNMISDFDLFFKQQKEGEDVWWDVSQPIQTVLDQIKFFGVDFDTSDMDEQLNALIFRMKDFVDTLDPESPAFKAANQALQDFQDQFVALGGVLDEQAAIDFYGDETESGINELQTIIDGLAQEKTQVELDIEAAKAKLLELQTEYENLKYEIENTIYAQIDPQQAFYELNKMKLYYNELKSYMEEQNNIEIDLNVDRAKERLDRLRNTLHSLQYISLSTSLGTMHTGGLVKAHAGLLTADEVMAVLRAGEYVHPDYHVNKYPESDWEQFRVTGDPSVLGAGNFGNKGFMVQPQVHVHEANRWTYVRVTDDHIYDRINYRQRKLETAGNPF